MSSPDSPGRPTVRVEDARSADDSPQVLLDLDRWQRLASACLETEGAAGELDVVFVDREEIAELNEQHLGGTGPTDVLSFPLDGAEPGERAEHDEAIVPLLLGDVVISPAVAAGQYRDHAGTLDDELALLVVHGVLHVLGHDHAEPDETVVMRGRELALLEQHHWRGPAPDGFRQDHVDP